MDKDNGTMETRLTVVAVRERVDYIAYIASDDEAAHGREDALWADVLHAIATGQLSGTEAQEAAAAALKTQKLNFSRWCA